MVISIKMVLKPFLFYWVHRPILVTMIEREWRIKYAGTSLRWLWLLIRPLMQLGIYAFVFMFIMKTEGGATPYLLHLLSGLIVWQTFLEIVNSAGRAVILDQDLLKKTNIPRLFLPLYRSFLGLPDWAIYLFLYAVVSIALRESFHFTLIWLPLAMLLNWFFAVGVAYWCNVWAVFNRDIHHLFMTTVNYLLWLTPVFYRLDSVPQSYQFLFNLNPLSGIVALYRYSLYAAPLPNGTWLSIFIGLIIAVIGFVLYQKREDEFIDYL